MEERMRCRAMAALCRQRAKMAGENGAFWLTEAERWALLLAKLEADVVIDLTERIQRAKCRRTSSTFE
jgi:hypothetical protein